MTPERTTMEARKVAVDFADARVDWIPKDPELAQFWNALSLGLPQLEAFLVKTMKKAISLLPKSETRIRQDCELFCVQEANHYTTHRRFNDMLRDTGHYPRVDEYIEQLKRDYEKFESRGLRFCMHYVEGFETAGPILAGYFLEQAKKRLSDDDVDLLTVSLWQWHLAEEFEHRCVAFNAVETLYGNYWDRVRGIYVAGRHLVGFGLALSQYMLEADVKAGRVKAGWNSLRRKLASYGGMLVYTMPRWLRALNPSYNPLYLKAPAGTWDILDLASETQSLNEMAARARRAIVGAILP